MNIKVMPTAQTDKFQESFALCSGAQGTRQLQSKSSVPTTHF